METNYLTAIVVLLTACAVLIAYVLILSDDLKRERTAKVSWRDAYANEAQQHATTRDELDQYRMTRGRA